jgi:hypothetical protein
MLFPIITANFGNNTFTFEPIQYYLVNDNLQIDNHVLIYKLSYTNESKENKENITAHIPYYVSNGHTNHFRANMLYPFICFNIKGSHNNPHITNKQILAEGGLFKYNICKNIDIDELNNYLYNKVKESYNSDDIKKTYENKNTGIGSVLVRLENIIDYIIGICATSIINPINNIKCYRPVYDLQNEYNMLNCSGKSLPYIDSYRIYIITVLHDQYKKLNTNKYFNVQQININNIKNDKITRARFNEIIQSMSQENIQNVERYGIISEKLRENYKNYTIDLLKTKQNDHFLTNINKLLMNKTEFYRINSMSLLESNIKVWLDKDIKKNNKYIKDYAKLYKKYKTKYINLKKYSIN